MVKAKVPSIRFPKFIEQWEYRKLNELLFEAKKRNAELKYGKEDVLSVSGELGIVNQIEHLGRSYAGASVHNYHVVEKGDIVYTKSPLKANPYGIIKLNMGKPGIVSTLYAVYKVNNETAHGEFLNHYFSSDENTNRYLRPLVKKGAKNDMKISNAYVLHDHIYVPSLPEQQKIASFFTAIDRKLAQLRKKKELLEQYKKGVMQGIFSRKLRFKGEGGKEFGEWEEYRFGQLYTFKPTNSYSRDQMNFESGEVKNIHYGDIHVKYAAQFDIRKVQVPYINNNIQLKSVDEASEQNILCREGDLVIADASEDRGDVGKAIELVCLDNEKVIAGLHTIWARPDLSKIHVGFGAYMIKSAQVKKQMSNAAQGTKVYSISATMLSKFKVSIPSKPEQQKIACFLSALDAKIEQAGVELEKLGEWKKGLLQKMFV